MKVHCLFIDDPQVEQRVNEGILKIDARENVRAKMQTEVNLASELEMESFLVE